MHISESGTERKLLALMQTTEGNLFEQNVDIESVEKISRIKYDEIQVAAEDAPNYNGEQ